MIQFYTPSQWYSLFGCPNLMIDDEGKIWSADAYYKLLFGEPSGRIDYAGGKIYGKDLGYGMMAEPIGYLETKNGVTEIRDARAGLFSAPILYIKDGKVYTPEQFTAVFDAPSGFLKKEPEGNGGVASGTGTGHSASSGSSSGSVVGGVVSLGVLVLALMAILEFGLTNVVIVLAILVVLYTLGNLIKKGPDISVWNIGKGLLCGFATFVAVYLFLFIFTTIGAGYNSTAMNAIQGRNELAGWIAAVGILIDSCTRTK